MIAIRLYFGAILVALALLAPAFGAEVSVRGWTHAKYARLVFDWPSTVTYSAKITGRRLAVRFGEPISAPFGPALRNLGGYVSSASVSGDARVVNFRLSGDFKLRSFKNGNAVVIDLIRVSRNKSAPPRLGVRVGEHPTYTRLVFDWKRVVEYDANIGEAGLNIRFNQPAQIDIGALRGQLPPGVGAPRATLRAGGLDFALGVPDAARLRHFRSGTKVVVDILVKSVGAAKQRAKPVPPVAVKAQTAPAAPEPRSTTLDRTLAAAKKAIEGAKREFDAGPRRLLPDGKTETPPKPGVDTVRPPEPQIAKTPEAAPTSELKTEAPTRGAVAVEESPVESASPTDASRGRIAEAMREARLNREREDQSDALVSLVFEWPEPVGAAVFARAGFVWIIFDKRVPLDLAPLRAAGKGLVSRMEQLPIGNATVLRMVPRQGISPFAKRDGSNWIVEFSKGRIRPGIQIEIEAKPDLEEGARLYFPAIEVGAIVRIPDPEVGDLIQVATIQASSHGIAGQRAYPEFQILASTQGIAVTPLNDDVELEKVEQGLVLAMPGGLHISGISPVSGSSGRGKKTDQARRIFKISEWRRGAEKDYYKVRQKLHEAVSRLPRDKRGESRLNLARFYFARGLAPEAKGVLQVIEGQDARVATQPGFKALKGAVAALSGDLDKAAKNLNDPRLDKYEEIRLWRGLAAARGGNWKEAQRVFKFGEAVLHSYPEPLKTKLALFRVEAALKTRDSGAAGRWLNTLDKNAEAMTRGDLATLRYLQGRVAFIKQDLDRATELWTSLLKSGDEWNGARADFSLVNLGLLQQTMEIKDAIKRLENLRYRWRGDEFEFQVLRRLGGLYFDQNDYRGGLGTYRVIATYFPQHPDSKRIAQIMTDSFKKLYFDGEADKLPALTALALYDEFRELTPAGPVGNTMIQRLAERLVDVDLLNRAADLLQHQVKFRLQGEERAVVGAKLALIRLLDRDPKSAIQALRTTAFPNLPEELADDRRRIQARAYFETGRVDEAVELLAGDVSRNADLLRADIRWRTENWGESAKALQRLAGEPPEEGTTFDQADAQIVLNWAVALRLDKDESGLEILRELYGPAMLSGPLSNAFQFISSPSEADEPLDLVAITSRIADNDVFDAFLAEYLADNRKRLLKSSPKEKQPTSTPSPPQANTEPNAQGANS